MQTSQSQSQNAIDGLTHHRFWDPRESSFHFNFPLISMLECVYRLIWSYYFFFEIKSLSISLNFWDWWWSQSQSQHLRPKTKVSVSYQFLKSQYQYQILRPQCKSQSLSLKIQWMVLLIRDFKTLRKSFIINIDVRMCVQCHMKLFFLF